MRQGITSNFWRDRLGISSEDGGSMERGARTSCAKNVGSGYQNCVSMEGLIELSVMEESEILVTAIVGMIGIRPTIEAIKSGKDIALANKETLVTAGHIIMPLAKEYQVAILPVDSEHSAIFQSLQGGQEKAIHKILLTASGGPFRQKRREELLNIQVEDALKHPNWKMGRKITESIPLHWLIKVWKSLKQNGFLMCHLIRLRSLCIRRVSFIRWWNMWTARS